MNMAPLWYCPKVLLTVNFTLLGNMECNDVLNIDTQEKNLAGSTCCPHDIRVIPTLASWLTQPVLVFRRGACNGIWQSAAAGTGNFNELFWGGRCKSPQECHYQDASLAHAAGKRQ
jgi:hypothetical protein